MNPTRNDLPAGARKAMIELLTDRLADAIDLRAQIHQAHWNVKGPAFIALHELFDRLVDELDEPIDDLAERAVQLGGEVRGTVRHVAKTSSLPEYPRGITSGKDHCKAVAAVYSTFARSIREAIDAADKKNDAGTTDLFTQISRAADKAVWLVDAHMRANS